MPRTDIEEFGRLLIKQVRDQAIANCDRRLQARRTDPISKRWQAALSTRSSEEILKVAIPDIVDTVIAELLRGIDQETLPLAFTASNGATVDLSRDGLGELCGWFMGEWRFRHSDERVVDDFADLRGPPDDTQK